MIERPTSVLIWKLAVLANAVSERIALLALESYRERSDVPGLTSRQYNCLESWTPRSLDETQVRASGHGVTLNSE